MAGFLSDTTQKGGSDGHDAGCQKPCIKNGFLDPIIKDTTDHGLRTPNEAFFHQNPKLLGLGR
jgi:hypothetical protein